VQILLASLAQIRQALRRDVFHVLHLSAHGSAQSVELEDKDGNPVPVNAESLNGGLRQAGRPMPLIVLSACSGGSAATDVIAARPGGAGRGQGDRDARPGHRRLRHSADPPPVPELAARPGLAVGQALGCARCLTEEDRSRDAGDRPPLPEYGVATLLAAGDDGSLVDMAAPAVPLTSAIVPAGGRSVQELPVGALIGRRPQLRTAMGILRHNDQAKRKFGAASGVWC
jgi:hypothetical protein